MDGVLLGILIGLVVAQPADPILREVVSLEVLQPALSHEQKVPTVGAGAGAVGLHWSMFSSLVLDSHMS